MKPILLFIISMSSILAAMLPEINGVKPILQNEAGDTGEKAVLAVFKMFDLRKVLKKNKGRFKRLQRFAKCEEKSELNYDIMVFIPNICFTEDYSKSTISLSFKVWLCSLCDSEEYSVKMEIHERNKIEKRKNHRGNEKYEIERIEILVSPIKRTEKFFPA